MKKKLLAFLVTGFMIISLFPFGVYADLVGINSQKQSDPPFIISESDLERLAWLNNVDPKELKDALMAGPDEKFTIFKS